MIPDIPMDRRANLIGSCWMVLAMASFAVEDVFVKAVSSLLPIGQVLILFGAGGVIVFAIVARMQGESLYSKQVISPPMCIRMLFEILGRLFFTLSIALAPLSSATAILQATPIVVVAGAALFFNETVGWRRWTAIIVGLLGVLIILRPVSDSFTVFSVLAVLGMLGFAGRDLASRAAPSVLSTAILGLYGFVAIIIAGIIYSLWQGEPFAQPDVQAWYQLLGAVFWGVIAYAGLMKAMRTGEVSAVTPFRYSRLLFGLVFGIYLFGEHLDTSMLIGCGFIVASGLYILWRSNRVMTKQ